MSNTTRTIGSGNPTGVVYLLHKLVPDAKTRTYSSSQFSEGLVRDFAKIDLLIDLEDSPNRKLSKEDEQLLRELISACDQHLLDIVEEYPDSNLSKTVEKINAEEALNAAREDTLWW